MARALTATSVEVQNCTSMTLICGRCLLITWTHCYLCSNHKKTIRSAYYIIYLKMVKSYAVVALPLLDEYMACASTLQNHFRCECIQWAAKKRRLRGHHYSWCFFPPFPILPYWILVLSVFQDADNVCGISCWMLRDFSFMLWSYFYETLLFVLMPN